MENENKLHCEIRNADSLRTFLTYYFKNVPSTLPHK